MATIVVRKPYPPSILSMLPAAKPEKPEPPPPAAKKRALKKVKATLAAAAKKAPSKHRTQHEHRKAAQPPERARLITEPTEAAALGVEVGDAVALPPRAIELKVQRRKGAPPRLVAVAKKAPAGKKAAPAKKGRAKR